MLPAFRTQRSAIAFCLLLAVLLLLPAIVRPFGLLSRSHAFAGMRTEAGPVGWTAKILAEKRGSVDILFLGSSILRAGVAPAEVEKALAAREGHPVKVLTLSFNWQGLDVQYFLLRDFLAGHNLRMAVWTMPLRQNTSDQPHVEAYRWYGFGDYSDVVDRLPLASRVSLYSDAVLGGPLRIWNVLRPPQFRPAELLPYHAIEHIGYYDAPFVAEPTEPPAMASEAAIFPASECASVAITGPPLGPYQMNFARAIVQLLRQRGVPLVLLHIPIDDEYGDHEIPERMPWDQALGTDAPLVGVPAATLFGGIGKDRFLHYYRDQHLNANGQSLFTKAIIPPLVSLFAKRTH
jgi:hypothetical protein